MNAIAIIPARGGSKRIPRKNVRPFLGRPIIAYAIDAARDSACFAEIMVSTDDHEIAEVARSCGAVVPFLRSAKNSDDHATTLDVLREVIASYEEIGRSFEALCCIYPTAALVRPEMLRTSRDRLDSDRRLDGVIPLVPYGYPIQRAMYEKGGRAEMFHPEYFASRTQDLEKAYHDPGQWYWMRVPAVARPDFRILGNNMGAIILDEMGAQDIDTMANWAMAEFKFIWRAQSADDSSKY